jgi:ATP-dependent RNA helicase RhlE
MKAMLRAEIETLTIHGEKDQTDRAEVMKKFRSGACKVLIATDLTARGIDIPDVTHVINYDLPEKSENYVHRIGRTGRGFNKGIAVSFCSPEEKPLLEQIETLLTKKVEVIKVSKTDYQMISQPVDMSLSLTEMIEHEESLMLANKRKKKKK